MHDLGVRFAPSGAGYNLNGSAAQNRLQFSGGLHVLDRTSSGVGGGGCRARQEYDDRCETECVHQPTMTDRRMVRNGSEASLAPGRRPDAGVRNPEADHPNVNNGWKPALQSGIVPG